MMEKRESIEIFLNRWIQIATGERQEFIDDTDALAAFAIEAKNLLQETNADA